MSEETKPKEEMISMEGAKLVEDKPAYTWYGKKETKPRHTPYVPPKRDHKPRLYNREANRWEGGYNEGPIFDFDFWPNWVPNWFRDVSVTLCFPFGFLAIMVLFIWLASLGNR